MDLEAVIVIVHLPETKSVEEVKKQGVQWPGSLVPDIYRPTARMHASLPDDVHFIIPVHQVAAAGLPIWHNNYISGYSVNLAYFHVQDFRLKLQAFSNHPVISNHHSHISESKKYEYT